MFSAYYTKCSHLWFCLSVVVLVVCGDCVCGGGFVEVIEIIGNNCLFSHV